LGRRFSCVTVMARRPPSNEALIIDVSGIPIDERFGDVVTPLRAREMRQELALPLNRYVVMVILMRFLVDAQSPPALARWLAAKGHEAEHVADRGMQAASDATIWDCAIASSAAIVTKDEDFAQRKALIDSGPVVVWIRLPNTR
jgi:predicted nuclease of predicted toxin-antitoxin system